MTVSPVAVYDRALNRGAAVSVVGHLLVIALMVFAASDTGASMFWVLAVTFALSLAATMLAWASARAGKAAWDAGIVVLAVSLAVLVWGAVTQGEAVLAIFAAQLVFWDWLIFRTAAKVLRTP